MIIPSSFTFDQSTITALLAHDPMVADYRAFFSLFDWSVVDQWQASRSVYCGTHGHPISAYLKAFLLRIREGMSYTTQLRSFLLRHPLLILELGFELVLHPAAPYGFDPAKTLPCRYWFSQKLRDLDPALLQALLAATVRDLKAEIPGLGEVVAFDVKHIYAWVKENNERVFVKDRYDKQKHLPGDPDCRLGVKKVSNQEKTEPTAAPTPSNASACKKKKRSSASAGSSSPSTQHAEPEKKELIWGYGSGVAAATTPDYGDVVLAEYTQPFNENDITYFRPLYQQAVVALEQFPTHVTADAAYDAWYIYDAAARHGGIGAIPLTRRTNTVFTADAVPLCPIGLPMHPVFEYAHTYGYRARRYRCPLLFPQPTGQSCAHAQFRQRPRVSERYQYRTGRTNASHLRSRKSAVSGDLHAANLL